MTGWYIRTRDSRVQGPFAVDAVRGWIASGRVRPDMEFSTDGKNWSIGRDCHELFGSVKKSSGVGEPVKVREVGTLRRTRGSPRRGPFIVRRGVPVGWLVAALILVGGGCLWWSRANGKNPFALLGGASSLEEEPGSPDEIESRFIDIARRAAQSGSEPDLNGMAVEDALAYRAQQVDLMNLCVEYRAHLAALRRAIDRGEAEWERVWRISLAGDLRELRTIMARLYPTLPR